MDRKPIPKSLHTVTVLRRMGQMMKAIHPNATSEGAIGLALIELGYVDTPDAYGLAAAALKQMDATA